MSRPTADPHPAVPILGTWGLLAAADTLRSAWLHHTARLPDETLTVLRPLLPWLLCGLAALTVGQLGRLAWRRVRGSDAATLPSLVLLGLLGAVAFGPWVPGGWFPWARLLAVVVLGALTAVAGAFRPRAAPLGVILAAALHLGEAPDAPLPRPDVPPAEGPDLVLVTLDTFRADHMSAIGGYRDDLHPPTSTRWRPTACCSPTASRRCPSPCLPTR